MFGLDVSTLTFHSAYDVAVRRSGTQTEV